MRWEDPRVRVVPVAGVSYRADVLPLGYVPREVAAELTGDEQAVSLWRVESGLRVLIVPHEAWVGRPR